MNMSITEDEIKRILIEQRDLKKWICKFQFFDRDRGQWSEMLSPQVGFSENFVQDETTDDASLNFKWCSAEKPNLKHMMWTRILHFYEGDDLVATYDEDGLPLNHNQYILGDFEMYQSKDKSYWLVKVSLLEPIERAKFVVGETLAFTNQISKTVTNGDGSTVTYVKDPYNHLSALERFLKVTPANCDNYDDGYDPHKNISWYNRIKIIDKEFLKNITFDSDSFTEPDLYTILFKYDKTTGRTPSFYFDIDPDIDLPRNLERDEYLLKFLRQDGFDKPELSMTELMQGAQNVVYKSSLSNFATGVVSCATNVSIGNSLPYPASKFWAVPELNSNQRDTKSANKADSGWGIKLPFPIKRITKLSKCFVKATFRGNTDDKYGNVTTETTDGLEKFCYEKQQYDALSQDEIDSNKEMFHFTEGDDFLFIKNYFFKSQEGSDFYYVEYEPLLDINLVCGQKEFATIYNQVDSQTDISKYSEYLKKYILSMNKADITIVKKHAHVCEMYELGSIVNSADGKFLITRASYQNINGELIAAYQLNKNHFRRNLSIRANKVIRPNMSIEFDNLKDRRTNFLQNTVVSFTEDVDNSLPLNFRLKLISSILPNYDFKYEDQIQVVIIKTKSFLKTENGEIDTKIDYFCLPVLCFYTSQSIYFCIKFQNNVQAGKWKEVDASLIDKALIPGRVTQQIPVVYTNPFGEIESLDVNFCNLLKNDAFGRGPLINDLFDWYDCNDVYDSFMLILSMPSINLLDTTRADKLIETSSLQIKNINILKDMVERLGITFQFNLDCPNDILIGPKFFNYCAINNFLTDRDISIKGYEQNLDLMDQKKVPIKDDFNLTYKLNANNICVKIEGDFDSVNSIAIYNHEQPMLIINNIHEHIKNGILQFFC